jgi:hypothetical protein
MHDGLRRLVPIPESCRLLGGVGRTTLYALVKQRKLTKVNIGSRSFITAESLEAFLDGLARHGCDGVVEPEDGVAGSLAESAATRDPTNVGGRVVTADVSRRDDPRHRRRSTWLAEQQDGAR